MIFSCQRLSRHYVAWLVISTVTILLGVGCAASDSGLSESNITTSNSGGGSGSGGGSNTTIDPFGNGDSGSATLITPEGFEFEPPPDCVDTCTAALECGTDQDCIDGCTNDLCTNTTIEGDEDSLTEFSVPSGFNKKRFKLRTCHHRFDILNLGSTLSARVFPNPNTVSTYYGWWSYNYISNFMAGTRTGHHETHAVGRHPQCPNELKNKAILETEDGEQVIWHAPGVRSFRLIRDEAVAGLIKTDEVEPSSYQYAVVVSVDGNAFASPRYYSGSITGNHNNPPEDGLPLETYVEVFSWGSPYYWYWWWWWYGYSNYYQPQEIETTFDLYYRINDGVDE